MKQDFNSKPTEGKRGVSILVIGRQHSGKTPIIKELIEESGMQSVVIYDPHDEYDAEKYCTFNKFKYFKEFVFSEDSPVEKTFICCDESTSVVGSMKDFELTDRVIGIEHHNNILCFAFHSIMQCPKYLLQLAHAVILLPTNDTEEEVKQNRPKLLPYFLKEKPQYIDMNLLK